MKAIITIGVSASGKSTWARNFRYEQHRLRSHNNDLPEWLEINRDWIRRTILVEKTEGQVDELVWSMWKWKWEKEVTHRADAEIKLAVEHKANIIISDTNLNKARRDQLIKRLEGLGYEVETKVFDISFEEACKRDAARKNGVGYDVIAKQFEQYNAEFKRQYNPTSDESWWNPPAVIVDVDGTLARMDGRSPFDWSKVSEDKPNEMVVNIVKGLYNQGYRIIVMSGRDGICYDETQQWLKDNEIPFDHHYQRAPGDQRPDTVIKEELFWAHVAPVYTVKFVIDDRPVMVRKWREMGLETLAVGNQLINF